MDARGPLVMALDDQAAAPALVGGKAASLARLARAGFRVPPGFDVTTSAYLDFLDRNALGEPLLAAMSAVDASDPATFDAAAARIGEMFAGRPLPDATAAAITAAYARLGDEVPVAVRSSATVEDLGGMSAAGQHDTYLNVRGDAAVLDAVQRCWASLWSARAVGYRARQGVDPADVSIAVVVQRLVPAEAAGVMFTVDPVGGADDHVVISANWGLGESVVAGEVTPDIALVDRASAALDSYQTGTKETMTVTDGAGTRTADTPPGLRAATVLSRGQTGELARLGLAIEKLYGQPMDIEWALAGGELSVVQARPVTTAPTATPGTGEVWNDSLDGDYLWSNGNLGEAFPAVTTPLTWWYVELLMTRMTFPPGLPGYLGWGRIGGRFYTNVSMSMSLEVVAGISPRRFVTLFGPVLGKLPPLEDIPRPRLPRWKIIRLTVPAAITLLRRIRSSQKRLPEFLAASPGRCDQLRAEISQVTDVAKLPPLWQAQVQPLVVEGCEMLAAATARGVTLLTGPRKLAGLVGEADAALLLSGQQADGDPLASLGPALGLARLARGEIDRESFCRQYGHRGAHEVELSIPRPAEDPAWIDKQLAALHGTGRDADAMLASQAAARTAAWDRLARQDPKTAATARKIIARWTRIARDREAVRSEVVRAVWVMRTWVLRAGELTGHGDDLFFLDAPEILALLRGDTASLAQVPARRATYDRYQALPPYPALIRGHFDPVRWAADPNRRSDYYDERAVPVTPGDTITGFPGAAGVVEGTARVLRGPEDAARLGDGEILVTTVTNIGWTPIFPRAAAVVTDVGAPVSHAAIVARELGIPAVVGCGDATMRIHDGDQVRVDGGRGTVEVLARTGDLTGRAARPASLRAADRSPRRPPLDKLPTTRLLVRRRTELPRPSRRADVCATAARLFREYGYSAATMDLIADEVGLNKGTLYHYYPAKSAILFELLSRQVDATLELVDRVPATGPAAERMRELIQLQVDHVSTEHDEIVVFFQEIPWIDKRLPPEQAADLRRRIRRYEHVTTELLADGVRSGEFRPVDTRMVMSSIVGILAYVPVWFRAQSARAQAALVRELTDLVMSGITAAPVTAGRVAV